METDLKKKNKKTKRYCSDEISPSNLPSLGRALPNKLPPAHPNHATA